LGRGGGWSSRWWWFPDGAPSCLCIIVGRDIELRTLIGLRRCGRGIRFYLWPANYSAGRRKQETMAQIWNP
jgi:hypothetical protein